MKVMLTWLCAVLAVAGVRGYTQGFPRDTCVTMFPMDYGVDAQTSPPPYELLVTPDSLTDISTDTFNVTLKVTANTYFEGLFVQVRMDTCSMYHDRPVGSFVVSGDFLKVMDCDEERLQSAVTHKMLARHTEVQFTWLPPQSEPGNFYFRATVVKDSQTFWTNVFSRKIHDDSDNKVMDDTYCEVCTVHATCSAPSLVAMTSVLVTAVVTSLWSL